MVTYGRAVIDWRADVAKWEQIAAVIRERVADGTYPPGTPVPSEHKLVQEFGVARGTAQKVLQRLQEEGVIYAVRGLGNFATKPEDLPTDPQG